MTMKHVTQNHFVFATWINANIFFLDPFIGDTHTQTLAVRFTCEITPNELLRNRIECRNNGNYELGNDTRVSKCLSLTSAFGVGSADVCCTNVREKNTEISKKSRWLSEWLIILTCIIHLSAPSFFMWLKSLFFPFDYSIFRIHLNANPLKR